MYKIIASDLDETLLNDKKHVSKADIDTISNLQDCKFVIATGRGFEAVQHYLKEINQYNKESQYLISFNGGIITENKDNRILYSHLMTFDEANLLFNIGLKYDVCIVVYVVGCCYTYHLYDLEKTRLINGGFNVKEFDCKDISFLKNENIAKVLFCKDDINYLLKMRDEMKLDDKYSISFSSNRYMEINPLNVNKGNALKILSEILNVNIEQTIGVGDNINDIELIETAGIGVGVKNTVEQVIPHCDLILNSTNNEDPITEIVNKYNIK